MALFRVKQGSNRQSWEQSDFPIVCESCLGPNPFVRMMKAKFDASCKICERPFHVFRWRPEKKGGYKKTEICQTCSKAKNVCQVCILDLQYGLPISIRDSVVNNTVGGMAPQSEVMLDYKAQLNDARLAAGGRSDARSIEAGIARLASETEAERQERYSLCSFWLRGECKRGTACPFKHSTPEGDMATDNEGAVFDANGRRIGGSDGNRGYQQQKTPQQLAVLARARSRFKPKPPQNLSITTIYVGALVDPMATEKSVSAIFEPYGTVSSVRIVPKLACAFVAFETRVAAEAAMDALFGTAKHGGEELALSWAHPKKNAYGTETGDGPRRGRGYNHGSTAARHSHPAPAAATAAVAGAPAAAGGFAPPPGMPAPPMPPPPMVMSVPPPGAASYPSMDPKTIGTGRAH